MKKIYNLLEPINNLRVIDLFIARPTESITTEKVESNLRDFTGSSDTGDSLRELSRGGLLIEKTAKDRRKNYRISYRSDAYRDIFNGYCLFDSENIEKLLRSNYTTCMIEKRGLERVYEIIKPRLTDFRFRNIASKSLLNHSITKKEYQCFAADIKTRISEIKPQEVVEWKTKQRFLSDHLNDIHQELNTDNIKPIEMLKDFEPVNAIRFYRKNIHGGIIAGLDALRDKNVITSGLNDFLVFDNYLSPLSSYPVNGTLQLLFAQPFQRIYEDIYLLDGESFGIMSSRAAAIYNNFADILFELIKNDPPEKKSLRTMINQMIFHWNIASTRFDLICDQLAQIYKKNNNCGNYHLGTEGLNYKIADLDNDWKQLLSADVL